MANTIAVCFRFPAVQFDQLCERIKHCHQCRRILSTASLTLLFFTSVAPGTSGAPLLFRNSSPLQRSPTSYLSPLNQIFCSNVLIARCSSFEWPVTSQFEAQDSMSRNLLKLASNLSSATDVAVVARVTACFAGVGPLKAPPTLDFLAHNAALNFEFFN